MSVCAVGQSYFFGPLVYCVCFSPIENAKDLFKTYQLNEYEKKLQNVNMQYKLLKSLNKVTLGYFVRAVTPVEISNFQQDL